MSFTFRTLDGRVGDVPAGGKSPVRNEDNPASDVGYTGPGTRSVSGPRPRADPTRSCLPERPNRLSTNNSRMRHDSDGKSLGVLTLRTGEGGPEVRGRDL